MSDVIKPFKRQGHFTVFDNALLDYVMPDLSPTAWKVLTFVIRKTVGWQKDEDALAYSQIAIGTGIRSNHTIKKALTELLEKGLIVVTTTEKRWSAYRYRLNLSFEIAISAESAFSISAENTLGVSAENALAPSAKNAHTKETGKKEERKGGYNGPRWKLPDSLDTEAFAQAWHRWFKHYAEKKDELLTESQGNLLLVELATMGEERAITAIDHSIRRGWKNIYEPQGADRVGRAIVVNDDLGGAYV